MPSNEPTQKPLQSWKEIAAYLERDVPYRHALGEGAWPPGPATRQ